MLGKSQLKAIAQAIDISESTVCREIKRHGGLHLGYNWIDADDKTKELAQRTSNRNLRLEVVLLIRDCLKKDWPLGQMAGWIEKNYSIMVSHEAICQIIH